MNAFKKWIFIRFTRYQNTPLPKWMFSQKLYFKSSLLLNGQCGIQVHLSPKQQRRPLPSLLYLSLFWSAGFTLEKAIACAVSFDNQHCGIYAGDWDSYKVGTVAWVDFALFSIFLQLRVVCCSVPLDRYNMGKLN